MLYRHISNIQNFKVSKLESFRISRLQSFKIEQLQTIKDIYTSTFQKYQNKINLYFISIFNE
jgi:hypothetical protein